MELRHHTFYAALGLKAHALKRLSRLGDLIMEAELNITSARDPVDVEEKHILDSLSLLSIPGVMEAATLIDVGTGGGLPALVLAVVLPGATITALDAQRKKCEFVARTAVSLGLTNLRVEWSRAEDYGHGAGRETYAVAITRAVGPLPVVAEYSLPLLRQGGLMVAMKGALSEQELTQGNEAVAILGGAPLQPVKLHPFPGATNRWAYVSVKVRPTPATYPRRAGMPAKRPLGL